MECGICYFSVQSENIFHLSCCKNNYVCLDCIHLLTTPLCPFCRARIQSLPDKRIAHSYQEPTTYPFIHHNETFINPFDDMYLNSRSLRRQMKRLRKLQERERDRLNNQNIANIYRENKEMNRRNINEQIQEEREFYNEHQFKMD